MEHDIVSVHKPKDDIDLEKFKLEQACNYKLEEDRNLVLDISALMLHRYNAGYKLDQIKVNEALSSKFNGFHY